MKSSIITAIILVTTLVLAPLLLPKIVKIIGQTYIGQGQDQIASNE